MHNRGQTGAAEREAPVLFEAMSSWYPSAFALPGEIITMVSALTWLTACFYLFGDVRIRTTFNLPIPSITVAAVGAGLAWYIAIQGSRRPGRIWPRLWALLLAASASVVSGCCLFGTVISPAHRASLDVLATANLAAAVPLSLRLWKVSPMDWAAVHMGAIAPTLTLIVIIPALIFLSQTSTVRALEGLDRKCVRLQAESGRIRSAAPPHGARLFDDLSTAEKYLNTLKAIDLAGALPTRRDWDIAALIGRSDDLARSTRMLVEALCDLQLSDDIVLPEVPSAEVLSGTFNPRLETGGIIAYYQRMGAMFGLVGDALQSTPGHQMFLSRRRGVDSRLSSINESFTTAWVATILQDSTPKDNLGHVLTTRLAPLEVSISDLNRLRDLRLTQAQNLLSTPGCAERQVTSRWVFVSAPSEQRPLDVFREIICRSYAVLPDRKLLQPFVELHLFYGSDPEKPARTEIDFLLPDGQTVSGRRLDLMGRLAAISQRDSGSVPQNTQGRTPESGFRIRTSSSEFSVTRPVLAETASGPQILRVLVY